jgi:hypothetical protein
MVVAFLAVFQLETWIANEILHQAMPHNASGLLMYKNGPAGKRQNFKKAILNLTHVAANWRVATIKRSCICNRGSGGLKLFPGCRYSLTWSIFLSERLLG